MLAIPIASRILPLTKATFNELLASSQQPGKVRGHFTAFIAPSSDERTTVTQNVGCLIHALDPDCTRTYGPRFNVFYYHHDLAEWIRRLCPKQDLGMPLELTGDEESLGVRLVPEFRPKVRDRSICLSYVRDGQPEVSWVKPPHDTDFLKRALPAVYHDQEREFTWGEWFMNMASAPAEGIFILHGRERMLAVVDLDRHAVEVEGARILKEARALLIDISPHGDDESQRRENTRLVSEDDLEYYIHHLQRTLTYQAGIQFPQPIERRWFFWQTYL